MVQIANPGSGWTALEDYGHPLFEDTVKTMDVQVFQVFLPKCFFETSGVE
jgi:hypothetical protein